MRWKRVLLVATLAAFAPPAQAQVDIEWRKVADLDNACDPQTEGCLGTVSEYYSIAKHEVSRAQYSEFLNSVAATDPNGLFNVSMSIARSGSSGSYTYATSPSVQQFYPVNRVSFYDALRFANWLHNGQPTGAQDNTTTEDGAYSITPAGIAANSITRNPGARFFLPNEDEWYKAAYYDPDAMGYYDYPAGSDTIPTCDMEGEATNTANCDLAVGYLVDVGSYTGAPSPYGTFDQGGNVQEWIENVTGPLTRSYRGGDAFNAVSYLAASTRTNSTPASEGAVLGFRVAWEPPFAPPSALNTNATSDSGIDSYGEITSDGAGNWVAVWNSNENLGGMAGTDWDVFVATSSDNAITWTSPALLNTNGTADLYGDGYAQVATDGSGKWIAVWESSENLGGTAGTDYDIFVATSLDNGTTWTAPDLLNSNGASDSGSDSKPRISTDGEGNWVVLWQSGDTLGGTVGIDTDIFVSTSGDNGANWSALAVLNSNATTDSASDSYPELATDGEGNWGAVWHSHEDLGGIAGTDWDIFFATSVDNGTTWTAPDLLNTNGTSDSGADRFAHLAMDSAGNWVAVWHSNENMSSAGTDTDIFVSSSADSGESWSAPALLNNNASSDSGADTDPQLSTDGLGNWVAVWMSKEDLEGAAGTDKDVLFATSLDNGATWTNPAILNPNANDDAGDDLYPQVTTDGLGAWLAVWTSVDWLEGTVGFDPDIFITRSLDLDSDGVDDSLDAFPLDPSESVDTDGDGVGDNADNCVNDANADQANHEGDAEGDVCDLDDDNDGIPDVDDRSPFDATDCHLTNPQLILVWDHDAPFGVDHEQDPLGENVYLLDEFGSISKLENADASLRNDVETETQAIFDAATVPGAPGALGISTLGAGAPDPGGSGSAAIVYLVDRATLYHDTSVPPDGTDDFGGLGGIAWSGIDRFNSQCEGGQAVVFVESGESPESIAEKVAHEAGHLFGLRHVFPIPLGISSPQETVDAFLEAPVCVADFFQPDSPTVMDGAVVEDEDPVPTLSNCSGGGCLVIEPPNCRAVPTGYYHNPRYHFLRHVLGIDPSTLTGLGIPPGSWDLPDDALRLILVRFVFIDQGTAAPGFNPLDTVLYNVRISVVDSYGCATEVVILEFDEITLGELQAYQFLIPETSALRLVASTTAEAETNVVAVAVPDADWDPVEDSEAFPPDSTIQFPPSSEGSESVVLRTVLVEVVDEEVDYAFSGVTGGNSEAEPVYEVTTAGTFHIATGEQVEEGPNLTVPIDYGDLNQDADGDGVLTATDNCPLTPNVNQIDTDSDSQGNACDPDDDGDGVLDGADSCPLDANGDSDGDGSCDSADVCLIDDASGDPDGDGLCSDVDPCPEDPLNVCVAALPALTPGGKGLLVGLLAMAGLALLATFSSRRRCAIDS